MAARTRIPIHRARNQLAAIWFPACGVLFFLMVLQTFGGAYGDQAADAWGWAMPNFMPTLALMVSVFAATALTEEAGKPPSVRLSFHRLTVGLSVAYLALLMVILLAPVVIALTGGAAPAPQERLAAMDTSNLFLGPVQSIVVLALGVLFFRKEPGNGGAAKPQGGKG